MNTQHCPNCGLAFQAAEEDKQTRFYARTDENGYGIVQLITVCPDCGTDTSAEPIKPAQTA